MSKYHLFKTGILILGGLLFTVYIAACLFLLIKQRQMIFSPTYSDTGEKPSKFNLDYEEVWIPVESASNTPNKLHGWLISSHSRKQIGTILYLHGAGGNISDDIYLRDIAQLEKLGFSVLIFDYRGYGLSVGNFPSEISIYEDAQVALKYLQNNRKIALNKIYLFGVSLGGAVAIDLAVKEKDLAGLIVVSSFTSMQEEILHLGYRVFPIELILNQKFDSISKISTLKIPVIFIHGTSDTYNPAIMSQKLFDAANDPKQILLISGFGHHTISEMIESPEFGKGIQKFVLDTAKL